MISSDLQKKIELIRLTVGKKVTESFTGNYESAFKGQGIEFDEVKEYVPGDDYRTIDWNVTARMGHPYIKRYIEERELSIMFLVDQSASFGFSRNGLSRMEMASNLVAALALAASRSNDKTGLLLFSDKIEKMIPPTKGTQHTLRLIRELMGNPLSKGQTDISIALKAIMNLTSKHWIIFLISDFYDSEKKWLKQLKVMNQRFDIIPIRPVMKADYELPKAGLIPLVDSETGKKILIDSGSKSVRTKFTQQYRQYEFQLKKSLQKIGTPLLVLNMDKDWINQLIQFFYLREQRKDFL